jgi:hypothetical protein
MITAIIATIKVAPSELTVLGDQVKGEQDVDIITVDQ